MPRLSQKEHEEIYSQKGHANGYALAKKYNVSPTTIYKIWDGLPPRTYKQALYKIRSQLEMTRGLQMSTPLYNMWMKIYRILNESLGDMP